MLSLCSVCWMCDFQMEINSINSLSCSLSIPFSYLHIQRGFRAVKEEKNIYINKSGLFCSICGAKKKNLLRLHAFLSLVFWSNTHCGGNSMCLRYILFPVVLDTCTLYCAYACNASYRFVWVHFVYLYIYAKIPSADCKLFSCIFQTSFLLLLLSVVVIGEYIYVICII